MRLTEMETKASVTKVRALMAELGVTMEHLGAKMSRNVKAAKKAVLGTDLVKAVSSKRASAKRAGSGGVKYRNPKTGATWSGFGRAPGWLADVKDRDVFLADKTPAGSHDEAPAATSAKKTPRTAGKATAKKTAKKVATKAATVAKAAGKKVARVSKKASVVKSAPTKKRAVAKSPAKSTAKPAAKKAAPRKVAAKKAVGALAAVEASSAQDSAPSA